MLSLVSDFKCPQIKQLKYSSEKIALTYLHSHGSRSIMRAVLETLGVLYSK